MGLRRWYREQSDGVRAAVITGIPVLLVGIIAATAAIIAANITVNSPHPGSPPTPTIVTRPPASSTPACPAKLVITSPVNGQQVADGSQGVQVHGIACGLAGEYGWVFDHDSEDPYYYVVSENEPAPAARSDGTWSVLDQPIGSAGDTKKTYYLTLVLASASCNQALLAMPQIDEDNKLLKFPPGCQALQSVSVVVTYPS
jgi:hypothetical protein